MAICGFRSPFWGDGGIPPPAGGGLLCPWRQSNQNATRETLRMGAARPYSRPPGPRSTRDSPESDQNPSGAQNQECLGTLSSGPPGPECAKFTSGAVQFLRLGFPTNAPGANPASPQTFPLGGGGWPRARRMRGPVPSSLPPLRGKVPPKGADEGALLDAVCRPYGHQETPQGIRPLSRT